MSIEDNKKKMRGMKTRADVKAARKPRANSRQDSGVAERIRQEVEHAERRRIEADLRRRENRHRFQTKKELEAKARAEYQAGKIGRGQLQKTIDRRWKAAKKRREKFQLSQKELRRRGEQRIKDLVESRLRQEVRDYTVAVNVQISDDFREVTLSMRGTESTLYEDASAAAVKYFMDPGISVLSVDVLDVSE